MREIIVREWHDDLGILHQERVGELVHCGNCIYGEPNENDPNEIICTISWGASSKWGYCSDGEKKE